MAKEEKQTPPAVQQPSPSEKVVSPTTNSVAFCCPHCGVYTHQFWYTVLAKSKEKDSLPFLPNQEFMARFGAEGGLEKDGRAALKRFFEKHLTGKVFFEKLRAATAIRRLVTSISASATLAMKLPCGCMTGSYFHRIETGRTRMKIFQKTSKRTLKKPDQY